MMQLTQEERMILTHRVVYMLTRSKKEHSWKDVLSMTYCEFLPDAEKEHGDLIAGHILDTMNRYETMKDVCVQEPKAFARYYVERILEGKSLEQQCRNLYCMIAGLESFDETALNFQEGLSQQIKMFEKLLKKVSYTGPFTEEVRDEMKEQLERLISEENMSDFVLDDSVEMLNKSYDKADQILRYRFGEHMIRSVTAMVMYTMVKNGELSMVPQTVTAEQITLSVCTEDSMRQLVGDMEAGYVESMAYSKRRMAYWRVYQVMVVGGFLLLSGAAVPAVLAAEKTAEAIIAGAACLYGIYIVLGPMNKCIKEVIEMDTACLEFKSDLQYDNTAAAILSTYGRDCGDDYIAEDDDAENQAQTYADEIEFV